jgi:hypothetical protein
VRDTVRIWSGVLGDTIRVTVGRPSGVAPLHASPLIYVYPTEVFVDRMNLPGRLDSLVAAGLPAVWWIALPSVNVEAGQFERIFFDEVLPAVERRYGGPVPPEQRGLLGYSSGANQMLGLALAAPGQFGRVASQSPGWMTWDNASQSITHDLTDGVVSRIHGLPGTRWPDFWFIWGDAPSEWESRSRRNGARVMAALREMGASVVSPAFAPGDHGFELLATTLADALRFLAVPVEVCGGSSGPGEGPPPDGQQRSSC